MTVKKLLIIGSISLVAVATVIVVPITVSSVIKNNKQQEKTKEHQPEVIIIDDDHLGPDMQEELDNCYALYYEAAQSNTQIVSQMKDYVYVCKASGLHYSSDNSQIYRWSDNSGVWDIYSNGEISLSPVVQPEQQFGGYYVYYQPTV